MDWFDGQQVSRPLGGNVAPPIDWPDERIHTRRPGAGTYRWIGLAAFAIVGATAILIGSGVGNAPNAGAAVPFTPEAPQPPPLPRTDTDRAHAPGSPVYAVHVDGLPTLGRDDAKVTVVVAYDYTCQSCDVRDLVAGLRARYGDELRVVFKPASLDPALQAACAAAAQGSFAAFDAAVWRLVDKGVAVDAARIRAITKDLEIDGPRFDTDATRCANTLANSFRELESLRAPPPAMFVNGRLVTAGEAPSVIDSELARATDRITAGTLRERYYREWVLDLGLAKR